MKKTLKKMLAVLLTVACLSCSIFALSACKNEGRTFTMNVKYAAFDCFMTVIMKDQGLLEKYLPSDVTLKWTTITSGSEERDAVVSSSIDVGNLSVIAFATALQNGMPLEYVAYEGANLYQLYAADSSIQSLADLKAGQKISVSSIGTGPHTSFLVAAQKDLGSISSFSGSMITMSNTDAVNALLSGTTGVDAVVCTFPTIIAAWNSNKVHMVRDLSQEIADYGIGTAYITRQGFAEKNPDIIEALLKARDEAIDMLFNKRDLCIEIMMRSYNDVDAELANTMLDYYLDFVTNGEGKYDLLMDFLYDNGVVETQPIAFKDVPKYERAK